MNLQIKEQFVEIIHHVLYNLTSEKNVKDDHSMLDVLI